MNNEDYFSLITNRIVMLQSDLQEIDSKLSNINKRNKLVKRYNLEREFILRKISYLKQLESLPIYIMISYLPDDNKLFDKNKLIKLFDLQKVASIINSPRLMTMAYIKDTFITDYDFMITLLDLYDRNFKLANLKEKLYFEGLFGFKSFKDLYEDKEKLKMDENIFLSSLNEINLDYSKDTLNEIYEYVKNPNKRLSHEFVLKHKDKVIKMSLDKSKLCDSLSHKKPFGFLSKVFNVKRNNKEKEFLNTLLDYYKNDSNISILGLNNIDLSNVKKYEINHFIKKVNENIFLKSKDIVKSKKKIRDFNMNTSRELKRLDSLREKHFVNFAKMLHSKCSYVPKMFEKQMWNEPDLKESLIREACFLELDNLTNQLNNYLNVKKSDEVLKSLFYRFEPKDLKLSKKHVA